MTMKCLSFQLSTTVFDKLMSLLHQMKWNDHGIEWSSIWQKGLVSIKGATQAIKWWFSVPFRYMCWTDFHTLSDINHWMNVDISHQTGSSRKLTLKWLSTYQIDVKKPRYFDFIALNWSGRGEPVQCAVPLDPICQLISTFIQSFISEGAKYSCFSLGNKL